MGTQQILMVVVSLIIVGAAIATGVSMMSSPERNTMRQHTQADLQFFASQIQAYHKTPTSMGGALGSKETIQTLGNYLNFIDLVYINENATYTLITYNEDIAQIRAENYDKSLHLIMTVDLKKRSIEAISYQEIKADD